VKKDGNKPTTDEKDQNFLHVHPVNKRREVMVPKVLVVDDEAHIRELVRLYLEDEGFDIVEKSNGADALEYAENHKVDLVILDIMMPKMDGWALCANLREFGDMPILMITSKGEAGDRIKGFKLGTDDYLVKPFDPVELVLRVKALLKRYRIATSNEIKLGGITLDRKSYHVIYQNGKSITIPMKEFELLYKLGSNPGQLFTRDNLIEHIWGIDYEGDERTVDVHIKRLRERFAEFESDFRIVTIRGLGYRLEVYQD
jgi:two-component system OmpR family response regulator